MNASARTVAIITEIAPALEASRRERGYYPPLVLVRSMIADRHGDKAANTVYHAGAGVLIQRHAAPLYSAHGAREFAAAARKYDRQPLQVFDWFGAHASPFNTALDWLYFRLERLTVGDVIRVRSDLSITRTAESMFKVYHDNRMLPVHGSDYAHAVACLMIALLFGKGVEKQVRAKPENERQKSAVGIVAGVLS